MSDRLYFGRVNASISEVVDTVDLIPDYELAAVSVLEGQEHPGEEPAVRRRLRAEGIRPTEHRGTLLLDPAEMEHFSSVGMLTGGDEVYFAVEWNDEFEPFPGRIGPDAVDFLEGTPLGLEEWMFDTGCFLALGDGKGLNYATTSRELHERLAARWKPGSGEHAAAAPESVARLTPLELTGGAGRIEALLQDREGVAPAFTALVCHPHPLYGGTLHNKVVHRTAATLFGLGAAVLRFNFRGVGKSEGAFDRGRGEADDARVALDWLRERWPDRRRWVAGFSFGSWIAARTAAAHLDVEQLVMIAPPVHTQDFGFLKSATVPKLVIQGTADEVCRPENLARQYPDWSEPKRLIEVSDASHFFDRKLHDLGDALLAGLPAGR